MTSRTSAACNGFLLSFAAAAWLTICPHVSAQSNSLQSGAGVTISGDASAKDVGLPLYPGSKRHKDKDDDSAAANFGLWGGGSGAKMIILKMESADSVDKVADFYRKTLAKYGTVLDCSQPAIPTKDQTKKDANNDDSSKVLSCGDDKPEKNGKLLKAGTKESQHIVGVQPNGNGALFQVIYLSTWSKEQRK